MSSQKGNLWLKGGGGGGGEDHVRMHATTSVHIYTPRMNRVYIHIYNIYIICTFGFREPVADPRGGAASRGGPA